MNDKWKDFLFNRTNKLGFDLTDFKRGGYKKKKVLKVLGIPEVKD